MANLNLYKSFYDVVRYGSFTKASKSTNISQPALSYSIKTLEQELNTVLLNRKNGELKLTEEGKILFNNLVIIFDKIDTFENSVKASNNEYEGTLNIGARGSALETFMTGIINEYHLLYPKVKLNFFMKPSKELYEMFDNGDIDLIIEELPLGNSRFNLDYIVLSHMENCFVTSDKEIVNKINKLKDLETYPIILPSKSKRRETLEKILDRENVHLENTISLPNSDLSISLAKEGVGIGYLIKGSIEEELKNEKLYEIKFEQKFDQLDFALIYTNDYMKNITKEFINIAKKYSHKNTL